VALDAAEGRVPAAADLNLGLAVEDGHLAACGANSMNKYWFVIC
jgi:hypothetical protein